MSTLKLHKEYAKFLSLFPLEMKKINSFKILTDIKNVSLTNAKIDLI